MELKLKWTTAPLISAIIRKSNLKVDDMKLDYSAADKIKDKEKKKRKIDQIHREFFMKIVVEKLLCNLDKFYDDLNEFLANITGKKVDEIKEMEYNEIIEIFKAIAQDKKILSAFFKQGT